MGGREAKDLLVQQTAEQAAVDNVPLSNIEKRMRYFTETGECPEDPTFRVLSRDYYILLFWRQNPFIRSLRMSPTYPLGVLAAISLYLLTLFLVGNRGGKRRGSTHQSTNIFRP
jgi:hypothetical protein